MLHGRDVLYVVEERAPGRPPLVTDVGVRLPAHLTASGRAILAALPPAQVRALYPDRPALRRPARHRPRLAQRAAHRARRDPAARVRHRGRRGDPRASPASRRAVLDHNGHPVAGVAVTYESDADADSLTGRRRAVRRAAEGRTRRAAEALILPGLERSAADPVALEQPPTMGVEDLLDHLDEPPGSPGSRRPSRRGGGS